MSESERVLLPVGDTVIECLFMLGGGFVTVGRVASHSWFDRGYTSSCVGSRILGISTFCYVICFVRRRRRLEALDDILQQGLQLTNLHPRPPAPGSQPAPLPCLNVSGESADVLA